MTVGPGPNRLPVSQPPSRDERRQRRDTPFEPAIPPDDEHVARSPVVMSPRIIDWFHAQLGQPLAQLDERRQLAGAGHEPVASYSWPVTDRAHLWAGRDVRPIRMGFMLDATDYGGRATRAKERLQERLVALIHHVLNDLNVGVDSINQQGMGDGALLFLPAELDVQRALPLLLHSAAIHLTEDNNEFQDRLRLRMAVDIGPVGVTQLGFGGATATNLGRMLDSEPLRRRLLDHPRHDFAVVISDRLHSFVVAEDVPTLPPAQFARVSIETKEFSNDAWFWTMVHRQLTVFDET